MLEEGLSSGAHLGLERSAPGSQAGGRLQCHPQPPARASEFCPSESRNVTKCEAMWVHDGGRLLASLHLLVIGARMLVPWHVA